MKKPSHRKLIGKRFGKLTVVKTTPPKKFVCVCDCGREVLIARKPLEHGSITSCYFCLDEPIMPKKYFVDLSRKTFGNIYVIGVAGRDPANQFLWECECTLCGRHFVSYGSNIKKKTVESCGCLWQHNNTLPKGEANFNLIFRHYKDSAKKRNIHFELTKNEVKNLTRQNCFYCNLPPIQKRNVKNTNGVYFYNGIDRVDNSTGYTMDNCVTCCSACNYAKRDHSIVDFVAWIERLIANYQHMHNVLCKKPSKSTEHVSIGLDLSLRKTGICIVTSKGIFDYAATINTEKIKVKGINRNTYIRDTFLDIIKKYDQKKLHIWIEGYSYNSKGRVYDIGELGGIVKTKLYESGYSFSIVPPKTLKKFVTGNGNAPKNLMLEQCFRKFSIGSDILKDDNQVDAFCLAKFGIAYTLWKKTNNGSTKEVIKLFKNFEENIQCFSINRKGLKAKCTL